MAGVTAAVFSADVLSSSGVDSRQQQWEYAVPVSQSSGPHRSKSRSSYSSDAAQKSRDQNSKDSRSSSISRQPLADDTSYLNPNRVRRGNSVSRSESDAGAWRDTKGQEATSHINGIVGTSMGTSHGDTLLGKRSESTDAENWIHRDKLARIESEELQQAAILFHRRGADSKSGRGRYHEPPRNSNPGSYTMAPPTVEQSEPWPSLHDEAATSFNDDNADERIENERQNWDLRRPEEIAADLDEGPSSIYRNPALRKSSSRIPIPTASPAPIVSDQLGRESRKQWSRAPTLADEDSSSAPKPRRDSEPTILGGSRPASRGALSAQNNSTKRTPKGPSGSSNRKTSAPPVARKATPRSRAASGNGSSVQRPTTRSGESRPNTAVNRPEGDPPWLATMYKPDPRLPPDQQILPTHARKIQQEQWEKEGKSPSTYSRDFSPLAVYPDDIQRVHRLPEKESNEQQKEEKPEEERPEEEAEEAQRSETVWPLEHSSKEADTVLKPGTEAGYRTVPKIQAPEGAQSSNWNRPVVTTEPQPSRKEKGRGCCVVM